MDPFHSTDEVTLHQFGAVCGDDIFVLIFENAVSINFYIQMESNQDSVAPQQIQALAATVEDLTRQNQEMKLQLRQVQQEENRSKDNPEGERDSHRRSNHQRPTTPDEQNSDLLREMRKEMDELRNAINEKTDRSVDRMVRATDSPFIADVLECPVPPKFLLPQLEPFDGLKDLQDHLNTFKTTLGLSATPRRDIVSFLSHQFQRSYKGNGSQSC